MPHPQRRSVLPDAADFSKRLSGDQDDLAEGAAADQVAVTLLYPRQRQLRVNRRLQAPFGDHVEERRVILAGPAIRSDDVEFERPDIPDIRLRVVPGSRAAGEQSPPESQRAETLRPGIAAAVVRDHIHPAAAFVGAGLAVGLYDFFHVIRTRGVDHVIRAEVFQLLGLVGRAGDRHHVATRELRELDAAGADAAAGAEDQHLFSGPHLAARVHHADRRAVGGRQAGRLRVSDLVRHGQQPFRRDRDELAGAAAQRLAHHARRLPVRDDSDAVAHLPALAVDLGTKLYDLAGDIGAGDHRHRRAETRNAAEDHRIEAVEAYCPDPDQAFARRWFGRRDVLEADVF